MKKYFFYMLFFLSIHASHAGAGDTSLVNSHLFELSGLLSFDSYANNYYMAHRVEFGVNGLHFLNSAFAADFEYRNHSVKCVGTVSANYRFYFGRHEIRPGVCGGVSSLYVVSYSNHAPVAGLQGTYAYNFSNSVSLKVELKSCWFFEDRTVFGTKVLLGMCWSFYQPAVQ